MHYPLHGETFAWGGAPGVIAALSCEAAGLAHRRFSGAVGLVAAILSAFLAYESALILIDLVIGQSAYFAPALVMRIFLINACAFSGLLALKTLIARMTQGGERETALAPRHA